MGRALLSISFLLVIYSECGKLHNIQIVSHSVLGAKLLPEGALILFLVVVMPFRAEIHHIDRVRNESRLVLVHLEVHLSLCLQLGRAHHVCHLEFFFSLRLLPILSIVLGICHLQEGLLLSRQCLCGHCFVAVAALV